MCLSAESTAVQCSRYIASIATAVDSPPPMQRDATPLHNPLTSEAANNVARMRAPPRCLDSRLGTPVIRSMPSTTAKLIEPAPIAYIAIITACIPELHIFVRVVDTPWQHAMRMSANRLLGLCSPGADFGVFLITQLFETGDFQHLAPG